MYVSRKQLERLGETIGEVSTPSKLNHTLHGGGKGDSPDSPDYTRLAELDAKNQQELLRQQTQANRVNQYGPLGSVTWKQGGDQAFDDAGYNQAMQNYQQALNQYNNTASRPTNTLTGGGLSNVGLMGGLKSTSRGATSAPVAPNRANFMKGDPNQWSQTTSLSPEMQAILDQNIAAKGQGYDQLQTALSNINNNNLPQASVNAGETAQDAILRRVNPQLQQQEDALRTRLVNQGVRPGSQAWDNEFNLFSQQKNDAISQAALQGISVGNDARSRALAEQGIPINLINAYQSGGQAQMPNYQGYSQAGQGQAADLTGAGQSQYNAALGASNAQNQSNANFTSGLVGLGTVAATFY
ncbi:MAG: hypothetical protein WC733_05570 [Methylophilus sp.]|jgi:hypothetical protein